MLDEIMVSRIQKEKLPKESGIYGIRNLVNGKIYVGSSKNIRKRIWDHKSCLRCDRHHNIHLQKSFNKYGICNFIFFTIELCDQDNLLQREDFYISEYKSRDDNFGYNIKSINEDEFGYIHCEKSRRRISEAAKKRCKENPKPRLTHCKNNHEFTEENTIIQNSGQRTCKACYLVYEKNRLKSKRDARQLKKLSITHYSCGHLLDKNLHIYKPWMKKLCLSCEKEHAKLSCLKHEQKKKESR